MSSRTRPPGESDEIIDFRRAASARRTRPSTAAARSSKPSSSSSRTGAGRGRSAAGGTTRERRSTEPDHRGEPLARRRRPTDRPAPSDRRSTPSRRRPASSSRRPVASAGGRRVVEAPRQPARPLTKRSLRSPSARPSSVWRAGRPRRRLLAVFVAMTIVIGLLITRIALIQTTDGDVYAAAGQEQRMRDEILTADRGIIFDRDGEELAISVPATTFYANPKLVKDAAGTAVALGQILQLTPTEQSNLATDLAKPRDFVYVARQLDAAEAQVLKDLKLPGIGWYDEPKRVAPAGDIARGVIGRTDIDGNGISGLEKQYDLLLNGTPGRFEREVDQRGFSIPGGKRELEAAVPGDDLVLTISRPIQYQAEQALLSKVSELGARGGTAIVMDPKTGELLAMASVRLDDETKEYRITSANIGAVDAYEPGSVAKVMTVAGALNEGTVTPQTTFDVPGQKMFYDTVLSDAEQHGVQSMTVARILAKSSNIGTIFVSQTIGIAKQEEYMRAFGFGSVSALDFPGESKGILHPHEKWQGTEKVTVAYGQGVAATALQLIGPINTIANNGTYVAPKLVKATIDAEGELRDTAPSATHEVVTPQTAQTMNVLMRDVVCDGTASQAKIPGYTIAGKTGTGYKAQSNGTYFKEDGTKAYYASFVGFLPAEDPQVTILVSIDEPPADGNHFGGNTAAPAFARIAQAAVHELAIKPPTATGGCPPK